MFWFQLLMVLCSVGLSTEDLPRVLLITLDAFRYDYLTVAHARGVKTPNFDRLIEEGVSIADPGLTNAFATLNFPNQYTMVTGLYEENHGVVANIMFDPIFNETFDHGPNDIRWWNGTGSQSVVPVWVTNEASGQQRASGVYLWAGGNVKGQQPKYFIPKYSTSIPFQSRINTTVGWFTHASEPINFGALYYQEPDSTGHRYGPNSPEIAAKIGELDTDIGVLINELKSAQLYDKMNIILTSNHGMENIDKNKTIFLADYLDTSTFRAFSGTPLTHILPNTGYEDAVFQNLSRIPNLTVYKKDEIPKRFHYTNSRRITPIITVAPLGSHICLNRANCSYIDLKGNHGWDNELPAMHPIFIARGPAFKKNYVAKPFETVNIYSLVCHLLAITPQPSNGSVENVRDLFAESEANMQNIGSILLIAVGAVIVQLQL